MDDLETIRRLERAMAAIPSGTRQVFLAHRLDDLSYAEIARRTGLTTLEVEGHMTKALIAIDRFLNEPSSSRSLYSRTLRAFPGNVFRGE